jgi:Uma2 family endonuclease
VSVRYLPPGPPPVIYPDTDGKPMAENTRQAEWIVTLFGNLDMLFRDRPDVFVAMDNFIYPVEGDPSIATAPDVYVVFGRPKGHRASYKVWAEEGIFPQVVCEVLSPSNSAAEMSKKLRFYQQYGADEYYVYDPEADELEIWLRENGRFTAVPNPNGFVSPRLGIRFVLPDDGPMVIYRPDGQRFLTFVELGTLAEQEKQRAEQEKQRAEQEKQRADRLAAKLRELGWDPDAL